MKEIYSRKILVYWWHPDQKSKDENMDTTSTDLISYLLCRGSASSFELPLFIILKKKWHQKKWKGEAFGYLLPSLKLKVFIKTRKHNTVVWKTISHVKMSLSRITVCKIHKTNKQNPEKPQLVRRQKGYQINRSQTKLVQLLFPSNHSNKTAWCSHSSRKSNIYYILLP